MIESLGPLAARISKTQQAIRENAQALLQEQIRISESDEQELISAVAKGRLDASVCAVDGGLLADRLFGADILIRRSLAVCFAYKGSKLAETSYHPKKFADPQIDYRIGLDEHESLQWKSLFRLSGEIDAAIGALDMFGPDYLLLDGSLLLLGSDKPSEQSVLFDEYKELLSKYKTLYGKCKAKGCQLIGVIKDSRGKRLAQCLAGKLIVDVPDTMLADSLLKEGERTCTISYCSDSKKHPVLSSLNEFADQFQIFYIKPSGEDLPLRVEYLSNEKGADEIASAVSSLCSISRAFAYPAALIEADMCAALGPIEMENVKRSLSALTGGIVKPLRRNARPFR